MIEDFVTEFARYRSIGEKAIGQVPDEEDLNRVFGEENNSIAIVMRHIGGNLRSRFTDFLISDGEKPWRNRDTEFENRQFTLDELNAVWRGGWEVLERELSTLSDADLERQVSIRGQSLSVSAALARSVAHIAYHVGQIVLLARILKERDWQWISIPKGKSEEYNEAPDKEKKPV
ncbi:MAG: DUF1572 domain-containing protein [Acidobacteria bacterium]|nr:MAG: DUF1572 domain-containing protein [Acidobacteriota bacterium]